MTDFMPTKKLLSTILQERTKTIEYRAIKKQLMIMAQNNKSEFRVLKISPETITMLENQGINVTKSQEHGYETNVLTW